MRRFRISVEANSMRTVMAAGVAFICLSGPVKGENRGIAPELPLRTLASLLAEGYDMQQMRLAKGTIFLRKWSTTYTVTYICNRGPIGSPAFRSYLDRDYDAVSCS